MNLDEPFLSLAGETDISGLAAVPGFGSRRPLPPPAWVLPDAAISPSAPRHPVSGEEDEPPPAGQGALPGYRWAYAGEEEPAEDDPGGSDASRQEAGSARLSGAGAFGGKQAGGDRRVGLRAFDPGKRGVKALAAVAAVVVVVAALLAWRARPHVDSVAPPAFDTAGSSAGADGGGGGVANDAPAAAGRSATSSAAEVVVAVGGKVRKPGLVRLPPGARVADALTAAGGVDRGVDVAMLNLARKVVDGELILVGVTPPPGSALGAGPAVLATGGAPAGGPVNLNTATAADLDRLPGVGPVLAQRILTARDAQGGFKTVGDLRKVDGIGDARYEQLKGLVTV